MRAGTIDEPLVVLSLGAGVQSTALALLAEAGELPRPDLAVFADTGWEPAGVYAHLDRLEAALSYPVVRVAAGNLRDDVLDPDRRFGAVPFYLRNPDGTDGMGRRQCTSEYKLTPIRRKLRELLGATAPDYRRVPKGRLAEQWVGFSTDEIHRANRQKDSDGVSYLTTRYPLLDLGMSRTDCDRWLRRAGWGDTAKSACIGCPYHGNRAWRDMRDNDPESWADAVAFDAELRTGRVSGLLNGEPYLHRSRVPLELAPIDRVTRGEWRDRQVDLFDLVADQAAEDGDPDGCSPYGCRSGAAVVDLEEDGGDAGIDFDEADDDGEAA